MKIKCSNCSAETEYIQGECEICPECGKELKKNTAAGNCDSQGLFNNAVLGNILNSISSCCKNEEENWDISESAWKNEESRNSSANPEQQIQSECPFLKVEYNTNVFFMTGSESIIKLKLTPLDHQLEDVLVFMESQHNGSQIPRQIPIQALLEKDRTIPLLVHYNPEEKFGKIFLVFYICCKHRGKFTNYQFHVEHIIYDSKQSGSSFIENLTINQKITSNEASDINYRDSLGDALKQMSENMSVNELINKLNNLPREYKVKNLTKTTWKPENFLIKGNLYPADRLILEYNGIKLFLLNRPSVLFGRHPGMVDLVVRKGGGRLSPNDFPNRTVSRKHAEIVYCEDAVKLIDHSSFGTFVNGIKPNSPGIPLNRNARIEFGSICWKMNIQECQARLPHNICQTCTANKVKSLTFTRNDEEPEYYLLIWQCCELGRVIEDLTNWTIFSRNGCFFIRTPEQDFHHLRPGNKIYGDNKIISVKYFEQ